MPTAKNIATTARKNATIWTAFFPWFSTDVSERSRATNVRTIPALKPLVPTPRPM